jgi:hypothetical protein
MNETIYLDVQINDIPIGGILEENHLSLDNIRLIVTCKNCHHSWMVAVWGLYDLSNRNRFTCMRCKGGRNER